MSDYKLSEANQRKAIKAAEPWLSNEYHRRGIVGAVTPIIAEDLNSGVGIVERVYYAIPDSYTIGKEFPAGFDGLKEAIAFAKAKIKPIDYRMLDSDQEDGSKFSWTRAFRDKRLKVRWTDPVEAGQSHVGGGIDMSVERNEIFLTDAEKKVKLEEAGYLSES